MAVWPWCSAFLPFLLLPFQVGSCDEAVCNASGNGCSSEDQWPIIIGGMGGSGTRLLCSLLVEMGVFMGVQGVTRSKHCDNLQFMMTQPVEIAMRIGQAVRSTNYEVAALPENIRAAFSPKIEAFRKKSLDAYEEHRLSIKAGPSEFPPWGYKGPRQMYFVPWLKKVFPRFHFVLVVRDVRDMANTKTSFGEQDIRFAPHFVSAKETKHLVERAKVKAKLWAHVNAGVLDLCEADDRLGAGLSTQRSQCTISRSEDLAGQSGEVFTAALTELLGRVGLDKVAKDRPDWIRIDFKRLSEVAGTCLGSSTHDVCNEKPPYARPYGQWRELLKLPSGNKERRKAEAIIAAVMATDGVSATMRRLGYDTSDTESLTF